MKTSEPRRGIERKILSAILWIGGVALGVALVAGYVLLRTWRGHAMEQVLLLGSLGLCVLAISFLCISAYRNVHNNIVRNLLLLKEGAQRIGQGDLSLKLKISTGDEIEELASSFSSMAEALRGNISRLEESEAKYRSLVTSMRDGIVQWDLDGVIGLINPIGAQIFGCGTPEELIGKKLQDVFPEGDVIQRVAAELDRKGFVERSRFRLTRQDGREVCLELSGNLIQDDAGNPVGIEGIFRDVTTGVLLEREAGERAERISAINQIANVINSSLQAGLLYESLVVEVKKLVDFDFAAMSLLDEAEERYAMRQLWPEHGEFPGPTCSLHGDNWAAPVVARAKQYLVVNDLAQPGAPHIQDFPKDIRSCLCVPLYATGRIIGTLNLGSKAPSAFSTHAIEVMEQIAPHVAVATRNAQLLENLQASLDEVTLAQRKLHEANEELKTLDEMKTNLLSNVSHELRTPLVAVMGYTDMIYNGKVGPINERQKEYLGISLRNIDKLVTLIENLLDFSRLHRGAETLVFDTFNLVNCARASIEIVRPVADSREISIELIAPDEPVLVEGDKGKLGQVFNNLLSNAVKFNPHSGSVTVEIRVSEDSVEAIVSDTGIGMPPEALEKVFSRFYQYDSSSTRKYGGTGIGLSIAQDIARLHGSRLTVTSEEGKGSIFRFSLPLKMARGRDKNTKGKAPDAPAVMETLLLVELVTADRALCTQVRMMLDAEGLDILVAGSTSNAVSMAAKYKPDCIIVDAEAGRTSEDVFAELLEEPATAGIPFIVFTADDDFMANYRPCIASHIKPGFRKSTLLSAIHYAMGQTVKAGERFGGKILCVDDDREIVTFITRLLGGEGYVVESCESGEAALKLVAGREYSLVLLDIAMPGIDGWEACRRIKTDPRLAGIKVYMVTAKPVELKDARGKDAGSDGYLLKPFKANELLELVQSICPPHNDSTSDGQKNS